MGYLRRFGTWLLYKLTRFGVFLLCWLVMGAALYVLIKPDFRPPRTTEFFRVCADKLVDGVVSDEQIISDHMLSKIEQAPHDYRLCTTAREQIPDNAYARLIFEQRTDGSYLLTTYSDSMGDPLQYHYRIDDGRITPLGYRYGGMMAGFTGVIGGFFLSAIPYALIMRLYRRWRVKRAGDGA